MESSRGRDRTTYKGVSMPQLSDTGMHGRKVKVGDWIIYKHNQGKFQGTYTGKVESIKNSIEDGIIIALENGIKIGVLDFVDFADAVSLEMKQKEDMVNHPKHYTFGKIEVITVIDDWKLGFYEGQVIKYVGRAKHKKNELEDLKKAQWYLNRLIGQLVNQEKEKQNGI